MDGLIPSGLQAFGILAKDDGETRCSFPVKIPNLSENTIMSKSRENNIQPLLWLLLLIRNTGNKKMSQLELT